MHKFNNRGISYSIDKCHLIYEKSLKIAKVTKDTTSSFKELGLITKLDHQKIINLSPFDPRALIEKQYIRRIDSLYDIQNLEQKNSSKKPPSYYHEFIRDLLIEEPPTKGHHLNPSMNTAMAEYFTVQATPTGGNFKMMLDF